MAAVASFQIAEDAEPISGYVLRERLGAGGYGEVWKADAPGGLQKAVKFVYGHLDEQRASRELRSLERIKNARHPFLLSLERVEIVDGHLIIVTELAEWSLRDRFIQCREESAKGIARDELLSYLRDAADALDYIYASHSLQHLDIKPENLLLVGGRVKVADFGMLKDLRETSASLVGGLTPLYSPPEVFDGRPNQHSDQYSLAIVYQELLTGELPFGGRTTAQLAAQHLQSRPVLAALPRGDQSVIARALEKDPRRRFETCGAMIDALSDSGAQATARPSRNGQHGRPSRSNHGSQSKRDTSVDGDTLNAGDGAASTVGSNTVALDQGFFNKSAAERVSSSPHLPHFSATDDLRPVDLAEIDEVYRPTLFLGIGGAAGLALRALKRKLRDRFENLENLPSVQMLLLDTDLGALRDASRNGEGGGLREGETLALPLRKATEYRNASKGLLQWMSRRWLYNIPRSLQTEGIRPLGRLALLTSAERFLRQLRASLETATRHEHVEQTAEASGLPFVEGPPRVYLVTSISGGAGSGMAIDAALAVRAMLTELEWEEGEIVGVLSHATDRNAAQRDLANANAYAFLGELFHFMHADRVIPAEPALGISSSTDPRRTFDETYVVHLGSELNDSQYGAAVEGLSDYLYADAVTRAGGFFHRCRELERANHPAGQPTCGVRTFGIAAIRSADGNLPTLFSERLCQMLVRRWQGSEDELRKQAKLTVSQPLTLIEARQAAQEAVENVVEGLVTEILCQHELDSDRLLKKVSSYAEREMGSEPDAYFAQVIGKAAAAKGEGADALTVSAHVLETIDALIGSKANDDRSDAAFVSIESVLHEQLREPATFTAQALRQWTLAQADRRDLRVKGAQRAADRIATRLREEERQATDLIKNLRDEAAQLKQDIIQSQAGQSQPLSKRSRKEIEHRWQTYARISLHVAALRGVCLMLRIIQSEATAAADALRDLWKDLNHLAGEFQTSDAKKDADDAAAPLPLPADVQDRATELLDKLEQIVSEELFGVGGALSQVFDHDVNIRSGVTRLLRTSSRRVALAALKESSLVNLMSKHASEDADDSLAAYLETARPKLLGCGGGKRLLLLLPEGDIGGTIGQQLKNAAGCEVNVVCDAGGDVMLCYEVEGMQLRDVAQALIQHRGDYAKVAARLHTRIDIDWTPM